MNGKTIIHLHFNETGEDKYFGSMSAIFDVLDPRSIGASYSTLCNHKITPERPFSNKIVTIKKGTIIRKVTNRKNPLK